MSTSTECLESEREVGDICFLLLQCKCKLQNTLLSIQIDQENAQEDCREGLGKFLYITLSHDIAAHRTAITLQVTCELNNDRNFCFTDEDCQADQ